MKKAVILVSGGIDSTTIVSMLAKENYAIYALSFNYQQRNKFEVGNGNINDNTEASCVEKVLSQYKIQKHIIVNIDLRLFGSSALTDNKIDVPKYQDVSSIDEQIPVTYVPARNTIFLSYALSYAEIVGANDIFIGVHATDHSNYPDCRPEFIESFEKMANLATKFTTDGNKINIQAPLIDKTKADIIAVGLQNGVDYSNTISCYTPNHLGESCGQCLSCTVRLKAFAINNKRDPIKYSMDI